MTPADWLAAYRERDKAVGPIPECQWRILCDLAVNDCVSVTAACVGSGFAPTTALRHLGELDRAGLIHSSDDPFDDRRRYLTLTDSGRALVGATPAPLQPLGNSSKDGGHTSAPAFAPVSFHHSSEIAGG